MSGDAPAEPAIEAEGPVEPPRPARPFDMSRDAWLASCLAIVAVAILLRFIAIDLKPLHHDEGVNGFFLTGLVRAPHVYRYDPTNYHGPSLYYLAWVSSAVLGLDTVAVRVVPALFGLVAIALVAGQRLRLGTLGSLTAAGALALSPGAVFHSRYFIHESLLMCGTVGLVFAVADVREFGRSRAWWLVGAWSALMFTTKETWTITLGVLACAVVATRVWHAMLGGAGMSAARAEGRRDARGLAAGALVFAVLSVTLYTSLFTNWAGLLDAFRALAVWSGTAQKDHTHGPATYLIWLARTEGPLLWLGLAGAVTALWRRDHGFLVFASWWAIGMVMAYSLIPYKTPWLTLNMIPPLAICAGYAVEQGARVAGRRGRRLLAGVGCVLAVVTAYQSVNLNFVLYDDDRNPYVYAQTHRELLALVEAIAVVVRQGPPDADVSVMSPEQFPLSWYLRDVRAGYPGKVDRFAGAMIVVTDRQEAELEAIVGDTFRQIGRYRLRPGVRLTLYVRADLAPLLASRHMPLGAVEPRVHAARSTATPTGPTAPPT